MTNSQLATDLTKAAHMVENFAEVPPWLVSETGTWYCQMHDCGHTCGVVGRQVMTPTFAGGAPVPDNAFFATCADCGQEEIVLL